MSSTTEMVDAISSGGRDVEQANPAYLYRGPLTPREEEGNAGPASTSGAGKPAKAAFGLTGLTAAMQVWSCTVCQYVGKGKSSPRRCLVV